MKFLFCLFMFVLMFCDASNHTSNAPVNNNNNNNVYNIKPKMLQIGIKKRIENCSAKSKKGDMLHLHYNVTLETGLEVDSSYTDGQPVTFTLGSGQVIKGWDQGLMGMCIGEHRKLVIPPDLAFGAAGVPPLVPEYSTLIFYIELIDIERRSEL